MAITGNVKFFSKNLLDENGTYVFTSASQIAASYLYDRSATTKFESVGSDDVTNEVMTIIFTGSKTIDRIFMNIHNIKSGTIKYWNGASYVDFSTAIALSGNADTTSYFEFDSVDTDKLQVTLSTTIVVDAEKSIAGLLAFTELGTMDSNASKVKKSYPKKSVQRENSDGGSINVIFGKKYKANWKFTDASVSDVILMETVDNLGSPVFIWPCGGTGLTDYGFRLQDIYFVNYISAFDPNQKSDLPDIASIIDCDFKEV